MDEPKLSSDPTEAGIAVDPALAPTLAVHASDLAQPVEGAVEGAGRVSEDTATAPADPELDPLGAAGTPPRIADESAPPPAERPTYLFFGLVAALTLLVDVLSKAWVDIAFNRDGGFERVVLLKKHLTLTLAYNKGGAWGLLQDASETVRRPFFLLVSLIAIVFIVSLYGKLAPGQRALKWGLPLVLGGALGNLADRVTRIGVVDFIDYRADWVGTMNTWIAAATKQLRLSENWAVTDHWPTFNVADIAICIGVGLMAIDMFSSSTKRAPAETAAEVPPPEPPSDPGVVLAEAEGIACLEPQGTEPRTA